MPDVAIYTMFVAAVLSMQLIPGPDMLLVMSRGIGEGRRAALLTVAGMTLCAGAIQLPLLTLGIGSIFKRVPVLFDLMRLVGAGYLAWLGVQLFISSKTSRLAAFGDDHAVRVGWTPLYQGMISNLTNPKPMLFMLALLPQFLDPSAGSISAQLLVLGATQKITGLIVLGAVALGAGSVGKRLSDWPGLLKWQLRLSALILFGLSLSLLFFVERQYHSVDL